MKFSGDKLSNLEFILSISSISFFPLILSFWFAFHFISFYFLFFSFLSLMKCNWKTLMKRICWCYGNSVWLCSKRIWPLYWHRIRIYLYLHLKHMQLMFFSSLLRDWISFFFFQFDQKVYCCSSHRFHWMCSHLDWFGFL